MKKALIVSLIIDILLVAVSFVIGVWLKPGTGFSYYLNYRNSFLLFLAIWLVVSIWIEKYSITSELKYRQVIRRIIVANLIIFFLITSMMYMLQSFNYSRFIVMGTVATATFLELFFSGVYFLFISTRIRYENANGVPANAETAAEPVPQPVLPVIKQVRYDFKIRESYLKGEIGEEACRFVYHYAAIDSPNTLIIATTTRFNIDAQIQQSFECILNVKRINDFRYINKYFESVNAKLPPGGVFIGFFESKNMRKQRILKKFPPGMNYLYYSVDFVIKRLFPKFALTKKLYFILTRGENRVISKAEMFGRLYSCGFEILDEQVIDKNLYFVAIKVKAPLYPKNPSYGPMIALERIGKGGKSIKVYKMRTMHPFAEYLQDYIYHTAGLQEGGKFKDDFRVTTIGRVMRKFWLDELPMLMNLVKGDLKIVGVRPLSRQYFRLYTPELQKMRIRSKPGLIPPFYVDYPKTLDEIIASEIKYLNAYEKHPLRTDWRYFRKAVYNILVRKYRSR